MAIMMTTVTVSSTAANAEEAGGHGGASGHGAHASAGGHVGVGGHAAVGGHSFGGGQSEVSREGRLKSLRASTTAFFMKADGFTPGYCFCKISATAINSALLGIKLLRST